MNADQIDVGTRGQCAHRCLVAGRNHVDDLTALGLREDRCHDPPAEPRADDCDLHGSRSADDSASR